MVQRWPEAEEFKDGRTPLHTFRADIDYSIKEALTVYGKIGIKTWICKGEVLEKEILSPEMTEVVIEEVAEIEITEVVAIEEENNIINNKSLNCYKMLQPKRTKFRKQQKGRVKGIAHRGSTVALGTFGLKTLEGGWLNQQTNRVCKDRTY
jgi:hypothetical protein